MGTGYFRFFACVTIILLLSACSPANLVQFTTPPPLNVTLSGTLYKPEGQGPFPAIVALHGYGGILDYQDEWVQSLKESGFVTLMVDSYCGRGYYCPGQNRSRILPLMENPMIVSPEMRAADASAALGYLQAQPFVDPDRIGVLGWSGGATAALIATKDSKVFKAAVGFSDKLGVGFHLLGRQDVFDHFRICFHEKRRVVGRGNAAALLRARTCSGCTMTLTGSDLESVRSAAADEVVFCPDCGAILVRTEESGI